MTNVEMKNNDSTISTQKPQDYNQIQNKKVAFLTLGCKVNSYETEAMQQLFVDAGATVVNFSDPADIYVVNTCTVTNIADRKSRQMLHKAKNMNEEAIVVAVGCYVQAAKEELESDHSIDIVIGNNRKSEIVAIVNSHYNETDIASVIDISEEFEYETLSLSAISDKTRAYIKIQDGCNQFCSYCIIPYARGRIRSRKKEDIVEEVKRLTAQGYKEIVLTGIHLSSYGFETKTVKEQASLQADDGISPLLELIILLNQIEGLERIRFGSLEPRIITEDFVKTLAEQSKICPHFHLSLQSGCLETLQRMNRKYTPDEYYEKCTLLRKYFKAPAITTDVIVGFPGETKEEYDATKEFLEKVSFAQMHVFKYSKRKGTKAEAMPNQVSDQDKSRRSEELIRLEDEMRKNYREQFIGQIDEILVEEQITLDGVVYAVGHNKRYIRCIIKTEKDFTNELVKVKIISQYDKDTMLTEIID